MFSNNDLTQQMPRLEKFAIKLARNSHDASDLLQSTLLRAMEKKHLFEEGSDLFKWTSKMMYNLFVSGYRRKVKFETQYDPESYLEKQAVEASQDKEMEWMKVNEAITLLSEEHRDVLVLVCVQGMRYQEVSEALNVPVGTIRSRLSRAREQLKVLLDTPKAKEAFTLRPANNEVTHAIAA